MPYSVLYFWWISFQETQSFRWKRATLESPSCKVSLIFELTVTKDLCIFSMSFFSFFFYLRIWEQRTLKENKFTLCARLSELVSLYVLLFLKFFLLNFLFIAWLQCTCLRSRGILFSVTLPEPCQCLFMSMYMYKSCVYNCWLCVTNSYHYFWSVKLIWQHVIMLITILIDKEVLFL